MSHTARTWEANGCRYRLDEAAGYQRAEIPMAPFGKARPRVTVKGTYMPADYQRARGVLRQMFGSVCVAPPWRVHVVAVRRMPSSWPKKKRLHWDGAWCDVKPDIDNILGGVMDALFDEDNAVVVVSGEKQWGQSNLLAVEIWSAGERPGEGDA